MKRIRGILCLVSGTNTRWGKRGKQDIMRDNEEGFYREENRVRRLRWIGIGIELILAGVGCIIAGVFFTTRLPVRAETSASSRE